MIDKNDPELTRDVSACEKLILLIRFAYVLHEQGKFDAEKIRWTDIDKLKLECDVLPSVYKEQLDVIEKYRP